MANVIRYAIHRDVDYHWVCDVCGYVSTSHENLPRPCPRGEHGFMRSRDMKAVELDKHLDDSARNSYGRDHFRQILGTALNECGDTIDFQVTRRRIQELRDRGSDGEWD